MIVDFNDFKGSGLITLKKNPEKSRRSSSKIYHCFTVGVRDRLAAAT